MKRILICTGVLGGGTALVFAAAALAASIAPAGQLVPGNWQQNSAIGGRLGGPILVGNGGVITKVINADGTVTLQNGPINNFGVVNVGPVNGVSTGVSVAPAPPIDLPAPVQPTGSETP